MDSAVEFVELHEQVTTSVGLLASLETFLSTFQRDLSAVSGQISDLQSRSRDIDSRLQSRKKIEKSLSNLISAICVPPTLVTLILDTPVDDAWIPALGQFEACLQALHPRSQLNATKGMSAMTEGLRIAAASKLRVFFVSLLTPMRASMSTNLPMLQSTALLKYRPLFAFLQRQALDVANEIQDAYVAVARTYYETGFRRYTRCLGYVKSRNREKHELITSSTNADYSPIDVRHAINQASIIGSGVTLAYMADSKTFSEPISQLFRSMMMVLMDNCTVEYTFLSSMFVKEPFSGLDLIRERELSSPAETNGQGNPGVENNHSRRPSLAGEVGTPHHDAGSQGTVDAMWKQISEPALNYCNAFVKSILSSNLPVISLLAMIKLNDAILQESRLRGCQPFEGFSIGVRLTLWPMFQRQMNEHADALKKLADGASGGILSKGLVKDAVVQAVLVRYSDMFRGSVALSNEDDGLLFSNLARMRQELHRLIVHQGDKFRDGKQRATHQYTLFARVVQLLNRDDTLSTHPKAQEELAFWRGKEDEARRQGTTSIR